MRLCSGCVHLAEAGETSKAPARPCNTGKDAVPDSRPDPCRRRHGGLGHACLLAEAAVLKNDLFILSPEQVLR